MMSDNAATLSNVSCQASLLSTIPPLRGEENLEEWHDLLLKTIRAEGLCDIIEGKEEAAGGEQEGGIGVGHKDNVPKAEGNATAPTSTAGAKAEGEDGGHEETKEALRPPPPPPPQPTTEAAEGAAARRLRRDRVLVLMASSISPVRDFLLNQGWDPTEQDPAAYLGSVLDAFGRDAAANADLCLVEAERLCRTRFVTMRSYQERLRYLKRTLSRAGLLEGELGELQMLWFAVDGLRRKYPDIHAQLVKDLLVKEDGAGSVSDGGGGSGGGNPGPRRQKLTWRRLMAQLAHMHLREDRGREAVYALKKIRP